MNYRITRGFPPLLILCAVLTIGSGRAEIKPELKDLARRIVQTTVVVHPGDVVLLTGGQHTMPLMEAVAIQAQEAGGMVTIMTNTDAVSRSMYSAVPEQYLSQEQRFFAEWLKQVDVWIGFPFEEDSAAIVAGVPESRMAKISKASKPIADVADQTKLRFVFVNYPSAEDAKANNVDFDTYEQLHWAAVNADYSKISEQGSRVKAMLQGAKKVRITSPAGTDLSFSIGDRAIFVDDGTITSQEGQQKQVWARSATLPGGSVTFAPLETTANGTVVVPKNRCRSNPLLGARFQFRNGKLENFKADKGEECYRETMAAYGGSKDTLGSVSIGLNPALKVIEENGADYRPAKAAGMVWIDVGYNKLLGGDNEEMVDFGFPITNATIEVDGKVMVKQGQLVF